MPALLSLPRFDDQDVRQSGPGSHDPLIRRHRRSVTARCLTSSNGSLKRCDRRSLEPGVALSRLLLATRLAPGTTGGSPLTPVAAGFVGVRNARRQYRGRAFDGAAFHVLSRVVLVSVPYRNNLVTEGVLFTSAAGEMAAGWTSGLSRQSRLWGRW